MLRTGTQSRLGGLKGRVDKHQNKRWEFIAMALKKTINIREDLNKFDRQLADAIRPLTDLQDKNINYLVLDKFSLGEEKLNDTDEL